MCFFMSASPTASNRDWMSEQKHKTLHLKAPMSALGTHRDANAEKMWSFFIASNAAVEVTFPGQVASGRAGS